MFDLSCLTKLGLCLIIHFSYSKSFQFPNEDNNLIPLTRSNDATILPLTPQGLYTKPSNFPDSSNAKSLEGPNSPNPYVPRTIEDKTIKFNVVEDYYHPWPSERPHSYPHHPHYPHPDPHPYHPSYNWQNLKPATHLSQIHGSASVSAGGSASSGTEITFPINITGGSGTGPGGTGIGISTSNSASGGFNAGLSGGLITGASSHSTDRRHHSKYHDHHHHQDHDHHHNHHPEFYKRKRYRFEIHPGLIAAPIAGGTSWYNPGYTKWLVAFGAVSALASKPFLVELGVGGEEEGQGHHGKPPHHHHHNHPHHSHPHHNHPHHNHPHHPHHPHHHDHHFNHPGHHYPHSKIPDSALRPAETNDHFYSVPTEFPILKPHSSNHLEGKPISHENKPWWSPFAAIIPRFRVASDHDDLLDPDDSDGSNLTLNEHPEGNHLKIEAVEDQDQDRGLIRVL